MYPDYNMDNFYGVNDFNYQNPNQTNPYNDEMNNFK